MRRRRYRNSGDNSNKTLWYIILIVFIIFAFIQIPKLVAAGKQFVSHKLVEVQSQLDGYKPEKKTTQLETVIKNALADAKGTYGIGIKNLKTGEFYFKDGHTVFNTASLYKVWIMAMAYKQIQDGDLTEDTILKAEIAELNKESNVPSAVAQQAKGKVQYSVKNAIELMITRSDNNSALLLTHQVKSENVHVFLRENGFNDSTGRRGNVFPKTTPSDMVLFFEKLYYGKLANAENSNKMMEVLIRQELNTVLPKYLPKDVKVAHKTGALEGFSHDAGIVLSPAGDYIITILSNSGAPIAAEDRMAKVSKAVYDYFIEDNALRMRNEERVRKFNQRVSMVSGVVAVIIVLIIGLIVGRRRNLDT